MDEIDLECVAHARVLLLEERTAMVESASAKQHLVELILGQSERSKGRRLNPNDALKYIARIRDEYIEPETIMELPPVAAMSPAAWTRLRNSVHQSGEPLSHRYAEAQKRSSMAMEKVIIACMERIENMAIHIAKKTGKQSEDLISIGALSVYVAVEKYEPGRGDFGIYASVWMQAHMMRYAFRDRNIPIPEEYVSVVKKAAELLGGCDESTGSRPDMETVAETLGLPVDTLRSVLVKHVPISTYDEVGYVDEGQLASKYVDPIREVDSKMFMGRMAEIFKSLPNDVRESAVLCLPYQEEAIVGESHSVAETLNLLAELHLTRLEKMLEEER